MFFSERRLRLRILPEAAAVAAALVSEKDKRLTEDNKREKAIEWAAAPSQAGACGRSSSSYNCLVKSA